jgi:hypothetical protein
MASEAAKLLFSGLYYLLPNFSHFSFTTEAANGMTPGSAMIGGAIVYAVVFNVILITITVVIFSRRNFK